jgi:NADH:ubiquinone oxidoreductase subunit F (NADH-binding)
MAGESAGQCGPCVFGLPAIAEDLTLLAAGRSSHSVLERLCHRLDEVEGRGACGHPDGVVRIVRSALSVFADDLASHLRSGPCPGSRAHTVLALPGRDGGPWR